MGYTVSVVHYNAVIPYPVPTWCTSMQQTTCIATLSAIQCRLSCTQVQHTSCIATPVAIHHRPCSHAVPFYLHSNVHTVCSAVLSFQCTTLTFQCNCAMQWRLTLQCPLPRSNEIWNIPMLLYYLPMHILYAVSCSWLKWITPTLPCACLVQWRLTLWCNLMTFRNIPVHLSAPYDIA